MDRIKKPLDESKGSEDWNPPDSMEKIDAECVAALRDVLDRIVRQKE